MKFKKEMLLEMMATDPGKDVDEFPGFKTVDVGEWQDDGKYSHREYVFEHNGSFYLVTNSRTGSYYSDYYYSSEDWPDDVECIEVVQRPVTKLEWFRKGS